MCGSRATVKAPGLTCRVVCDVCGCRRGANILAEVVGYGMAADGHHITAPCPEGDEAEGGRGGKGEVGEAGGGVSTGPGSTYT